MLITNTKEFLDYLLGNNKQNAVYIKTVLAHLKCGVWGGANGRPAAYQPNWISREKHKSQERIGDHNHWLVVDCRPTFPPQDNSNSDKRIRVAGGKYKYRGWGCLHMRDFKQANMAQLIGVVQVKFKYLLILFDVCVWVNESTLYHSWYSRTHSHYMCLAVPDIPGL